MSVITEEEKVVAVSSPSQAGTQYAFFFGGGAAEGNGKMKDVLGGKGAGLAEMTNVGLPVPPGFTIQTEACREYMRGGLSPDVDIQMNRSLDRLEKLQGQKLGQGENPLLVSVRSGAKFSMPGMMDTILNLGLNDKSVEALAKKTNNPRFAYDSYRRLIQMFGDVVLDVKKAEFEEIFDGMKKKKHIKLDAVVELRVNESALLQRVESRVAEMRARGEDVRIDDTPEVLAKRPGLVGKDGSHTAGNSPGVNDGGGALVLASDEWAQANGKTALAEIVAHAQSANDFAYLATTPGSAALKALDKAGLQPGDIDLWEINEAFASVTLNSMRMLDLDEDRVNVNGGAVAIGHPIGASGARILGTLVYELRRRGGGYGCAAICSGGGQGDAVIVKV